MDNRKYLWALPLLFFLLAAACGPASGPIIVFCSPDSSKMRQVIAGLEAGVGRGPLQVVCVPEAGPEGPEALRRLRRQKPRLLVVLGTAALRWTAPVEKSLPVVFGAVANPFFTGAIYDPEHPEIHQENVTGIASPPPLNAALKQGAKVLGAGPWGLLYDPREGAAVDLAQAFTIQAPRFDIKPLTETSSGAAQDRQGLQRLLDRGARVIYLPPTNGAGRYAPLLLSWGREGKVLVVSGRPEGPQQGAVLRVARDYYRLGQELAGVVQRVLAGEAPARIPVSSKTPLQVEWDEGLLKRWAGYPPPARVRRPSKQ